MIELVHHLPQLDQKLIELLSSLTKEEWTKQTIAKKWKVKDVVAHLLDGNIRTLSGLRDSHKPEAPQINSYQDLLGFLNQLNADWVQAMQRVSPQFLIELLKFTGEPFYKYYASLDPNGKAEYSVAWAGENESKNWMHIAREYTEKFLHQQQIRDAVGKQGIMTQEFYIPFLDTCMYALPFTLKETITKEGSVLKFAVTGDVKGEWFVRYNGTVWELSKNLPKGPIISSVTIDADASWKLFSKSLRADDLRDKIIVEGDKKVAEVALGMVSFMA
ncbi:maleylpyruvate isomerase N-terminal domain-containing protein [Flammeovirga aprica]|uniref:Maleylpyruvate isomerase family protein n=1 Tax=Flammeovirga aprica JL-4 TaxID=694437 RepID=A0A7X9RYR6_9BACT|nr:maleylpyruvate isomerase N-terminal domain-containing protein [Flammeovirga aprica]NME71181.1 maleylpyruvate isomerase family protein [Flammeovirga aprica JL-4]